MRAAYRSRAEADQLAAEYLAGHLSREQFCANHGLSVKSLARYVTRYRRRLRDGGDATVSADGPRFIPVDVDGGSSKGSCLAVLLASGRRIEVSRGFEEETLRRLVATLERS